MAGKADKVQPPPAFSELPWLVHTHGSSMHKQVQMFYSVSPTLNPKSYIKSIPQLRDKKILVSLHQGWLLLQDRIQLSLLSVFNPFTLQTINLPPLLAAVDHGQTPDCAITSSPDCDACVLALCYNADGLVLFCRPAQPNCAWVIRIIELEGEQVDIDQMAALDGVIYGLTTKPGVFLCMDVDLKPPTIRPFQIQRPDLDDYADGYMTFLMESCDRLYYVILYFVSDPSRNFVLRVYELDLQEKICFEVKNLNGRAFFLSSSGSGCTWCWGTANPLESQLIGGIERDCIYFYMPCFGENTLLIHSLLDKTQTILSPCPSLFSTCDPLFWAVPQQQRLLPCGAGSLKKDVILNHRVSPFERQKLPVDEETQESILSKLPFHMIELISGLMHLFEYWNFHASCKILRSGLPEPLHRTRSDPLFMIFKDHDGSCTITDPFRHDSRSKNILPVFLDTFTLEFSKNGWLLYLVGKTSLQYINVFSGVRGDFPPIPDMGVHYNSVAFSTDPTCSECLTVAIFGNEEFLSFCYLRSGDKAWSTRHFYPQAFPFCPNFNSPISIEGAFYFLDTSGYLGEFELVDGYPTWHVYDKPPIRNQNYYLSTLVECDGEIYAVFIGEMGNWVQVFWFDYWGESNWVEIDHLKSHILFITRKSSFSIVSRDPKMRNMIFFPWLRGKDVVYYSQDTNKYYNFGGHDVMENLYGLKEPLYCCWI